MGGNLLITQNWAESPSCRLLLLLAPPPDFEFPLWELKETTEAGKQILEKILRFKIDLPKIPMAPSSASIKGLWSCHYTPGQYAHSPPFSFTPSPCPPRLPASQTLVWRGIWFESGVFLCDFFGTLSFCRSAVVKQVSTTSGVPVADSFEVLSLYRATKSGEGKTKLKITMQINYLKFTMLKCEPVPRLLLIAHPLSPPPRSLSLPV